MAATRDTSVSIAQGKRSGRSRADFYAHWSPLSARTLGLADSGRSKLALIEWLKLDDRCSVIATYPERRQARIAAAGWSEGEAPADAVPAAPLKTPPAPPWAIALLTTVPAPPPGAELVALASPPAPAPF
jgi:hypothetical protein